jgi:alpha-beta hydrolase superfamily lysophospholipase
MAFASDQAALFDRLDEAVCLAPAPSLGLFAKIIAGACIRVPVLDHSGNGKKMDRLVESGAWVDAVLALIDLELPGWRLRRLAYEDGSCFCSLSRQPNLPAALDNTADGHHEIMSLAILRAFLQARRMAAAESRPAASVPVVEPTEMQLFCCENFA